MAEFLFDFLHIPFPDFLCGLGFLFLSLCYITTNPCFPICWKQRDTNLCQCRSKRRRKGGTLKGRRTYQKEVEEGRKLLSILKSSSPGQHLDTTCFRQLLCPDPLCEVCNRTAAEISHLLYMASLEDAAPSSSRLASTTSVRELSSSLFSDNSTMPIEEPIPAPLPEPRPSSPSILSPNQVTPLAELFLPSSFGDSLPTEPVPPLDSRFPVDRAPPQMRAFPTLPTHHTQATAPVLQPGDTLCPVGSSAGLSNYVSTVRDTGCSNLAIPQYSWWKAHKNNVILPGLPHYNFQQENISLPIPDSYFWKNTSNVEAHHVSFLGLNIQEVLQRQIKKKTPLQILEKQEKEHEPFLQQKWSKYQLASWNSVQALGDKPDITSSPTDWDIKGKPGHLGIFLEQKYSQLFWGLPSLHSESIVATLLVSRSCSSLQPHVILFNGICNASAVQMQGQESLQLSHSHHPHFSSVHPHPLPQMNPQSQTLTATQVHSQAHVKAVLPILPLPSSSQMDCGGSCHRLQNRADCHIFKGNQHLEWHVLQKHHQESLWGLGPEFQKCQEAFCPPTPKLPLVRQSPQTYVPVTIFPGHFHIRNHPQENQEHHEPERPERLIPSWNLQSYHNLGSLALMESKGKSTEIAQHNCRHVHLQSSEFQGHSSKDLGKREVSPSGSFHESFPTKVQLKMDSSKNLGHILGKCILDNPLVVSESHARNDLDAESKKKSSCVRLSRDDPGNELRYVTRKTLDVNQMKSILRLHVSRKSWQINTGRIPISICHSWLREDSELPPPSRDSHTNTENRKMAPLVCRVQCHITNLERPFLDHKTQQALEAHIIRFRVSQKWGLPLKVLESIKFYMLREAKTWPLPQCDFLPSSTSISVVDSKSDIFRPLRVGAKASHSNKVEGINSPFIMDPSPPATSAAMKGQNILRQSCCDAYHEVTERVQTMEAGRQTHVSCTHSVTDRVSQKDTEQVSSAFMTDHSVALEGQSTLRQASCDAFHEAAEHVQTTKAGRKSCVFSTHSVTDRVSQNHTKQVSSASIIDHCPPATSSVAINGQNTLRQSCCDTSHVVTECVQSTEAGRHTCMSYSHSITDKVTQNDLELENGCSPELSTRQGRDGHERRDETASSSHHQEMCLDLRVAGKSDEHFSTSCECRQIFEACELWALQSQANGISTTSQLESSHITSKSVNKIEITTEHPPRIPEDPLLLDLKRQPPPGTSCSDMSLPSDSLTSDTSLSHSCSGSSGDLGAFQAPHLHLDYTGICMEQQMPWEPQPLLWKYEAKSFPPVERRLSPTRCQRGKHRDEDLGLEASVATRNSHPAKDRKLEEASKSLPQNLPSVPESYFKRKIKQFFQWLDCRKKSTVQQSPVKDKALFMSCGPPEAHELMAALGKILEEKLTCTQEDVPQNKEPLVQVESNYGQPSVLGDACGSQQEEASSLCSCNQETVSFGPICHASAKQVRDSRRPLQMTMPFKDKVSFQSHPPSPPCRKPRFNLAPPALRYSRCLWLPSNLMKALGSET